MHRILEPIFTYRYMHTCIIFRTSISIDHHHVGATEGGTRHWAIYVWMYIYQHMPRGAVMAPLREGVSKWRPFVSKLFLNLFWVIWDIRFIFVI